MAAPLPHGADRRAVAGPHPSREAQRRWSELPIRERLVVVRRFRHSIVARADDLIAAIGRDDRRAPGESLVTELLPLADACRYLERRARALLAGRRLGRRDRPVWLAGLNSEVLREPWGLVLVVGPSNYPLLLPGIQLMQAVVAGNGVALKPGRDGSAAARLLAQLLLEAGAPRDLVVVLDEAVESVETAIAAGVDHVVLTGSAATGRSLLARLAHDLIPSVMELSGSDPSIVRADADLELAARAIRFGMTLNAGDTCIAPRRVFVDRSVAATFERLLAERLRGGEPLPVRPEVVQRLRPLVEAATRSGARIVCGAVPEGSMMAPLVLAKVAPTSALLHEDLAAPIVSLVTVDGDEEAIVRATDGPFGLGATIFGGADAASALARRLDAGIVVINDMIAPTADPRVPFGGRGASGFGVTRGAEGLLSMTRPKAILRRGGRFRPHFDPVGPEEATLLDGLLRASHSAKWGQRMRGWFDLLAAMAQAGGKRR